MKLSQFSRIWMLFLVFSVFFITAGCGATQHTDTGLQINSEIDENIYKLVIQLEEEAENYSQTNMSFRSYNNVSSATVWQDGKGLVRGKILSVDPLPSFASPEMITIAKTTDFRIMSLKPGDTVSLACLADYEPVCARTKTGNVGKCDPSWEFDYCRMVSFQPKAK
jgi:hypothetical protein